MGGDLNLKKYVLLFLLQLPEEFTDFSPDHGTPLFSGTKSASGPKKSAP
jgi:hypothetical protein